MWAGSLVCIQHRGCRFEYLFFYCILIMTLEMGFFISLFKEKKKKEANQFVIVFFGMQMTALCRWGVVLRFPPETASLLNSFKVWFVIKRGISYHYNELMQHGSVNISPFS